MQRNFLIYIVFFVSLVSGAALAAKPAPVSDTQAAINRLQQQITQVQASIPGKIQTQAKVTQKSIKQLQQQTQQQLVKLQAQMQQLQNNLVAQITQLQREMKQFATLR